MTTVPTRLAQLAARRAEMRARARRRRRRAGIVALALLVLFGIGAGGGAILLGWFNEDYEGTGEGHVVVRVLDGDSTTRIGEMLADRGVVANAKAFTSAAARNGRIRSVQPGYYQMHRKMSGAAAVSMLLDPASRVGHLDIRGGVQLDDTRAPNGAVTPGVLSLIAQASCAVFDGQRRCVGVEDLRQVMAETDPAELGVPDWAVQDVRRADPARRLEGLFMPGVYDIAPGTPAVEVLRGVLAVSVARLESTGIADDARAMGFDPYQVLVVASLVEKEAITPDMPKVARVVYNRLDAGQRLELDSTVNYPLDVQALRTTAAARAQVGPYNTYAVTGLPPTPIAAAGKTAVAAALAPQPGPWTFFVRCEQAGTSCFSTSLGEHEENVRQAIANGAF
ncbi:endolytic transglycosylase MltG [Pseudonocardia asaccharolytica]|uniref:endolytic transglycosylase MltG n=1 Tax=Pseudonocardia asaccharolytica TaxID=54010 RepID=UPI0021BF304C|nr:endolytic transglycosylase MltG [Pseudonocardia asaccharolytica]